MRKRYLTIYKKLSTLVIVLTFSCTILAKEKKDDEDTNIICFAAQNKWVCAPEDRQQLANEKAQKLLKDKGSEYESTEVVIKSINIPKFETVVVNNNKEAEQAAEDISNVHIEQEKAKPKAAIKLTQGENSNPYALLWSHQLIGLSTPQSAINYVQNKKLNKNDILIIKSIRNNMDWWIVLYGLYKDKQTGLDNEMNLPVNIDKPWLRPLKNLQVNGYIEKF
jgi:septal ring-binding cell division protein DamX